MSVLEIVFVGECEVFVGLDFPLSFFFLPLAAKLIGPRTGCQFLKKSRFFRCLAPYPLRDGDKESYKHCEDH